MKPIKILIPALLVALSISAQTPTWSDNIACIVYTRCASCHNPNGIAPFSLITYQEVYNARGIMWAAITTGKMPPWPPDHAYQTYVHERTLTQEEIDIFNAWVNGNAPEGNPANAPEQPVFSVGSELQSIDLTLKMPVYTNPAVNDDYRCFVMTTNLTEDMFITGWEAIPGNRNMVHHVLVFQDTTGTALNKDNADPGPGYTSFGGIGTNGAILIGGWVPGSSASYMPQGMGIKLFKNALVVMQVHYPNGTSGMEDSTKINMILSNNQNIRAVRLAPILNHSLSITDGPLYIPANMVKTFHEAYTLPMLSDITVLSVGPHMHLIGKSIISYAITPALDTINFININNWDFHWQGSYAFRQPIRVPKGSTLYAEATYDNTSANLFNPSQPPQDVSLGEATTDEMMLVYFAFLPYQNGDENIVIDTVTSVTTYNNCNYKLPGVTGAENIFPGSVQVYPNPTESYLNVKNSHAESLKAELYDAAGKKIAARMVSPVSNVQWKLNVEPGVYMIRLMNESSGAVENHRIIML